MSDPPEPATAQTVARLIAKKVATVLVDMPITLVAARLVSMSIGDGLWKKLLRTSVFSGKPFPVGSVVVAVMCRDEKGGQFSGACHADELPAEVRNVIDVGATWKEKT